MNTWLAAGAAVLVLGVGPTLWGAATGPVRRRVTAQNLATLFTCQALLLLAQGYARSSYVDVALVLSVLGPAGTLVFARLLTDELAADPPRGRVASAMTPVALLSTALVVVPLCVVTAPGRGTVKLLVIGALLVAGNIAAGRAVAGAGATAVAPVQGRP